uniref:uncharacterized protein LOC122591816 n=1 Tax=Erigeron canadensis TaxID=72917 RepID=UPI001CB8A4C3|nr:uncharacterized protein LOC122591816 [Erigeron canadensis]
MYVSGEIFGDLDLNEAKRFCYESYIPERFEDYLQNYRVKQLEDVHREWRERGFEDEPLKLEPEKFAPDFNEEYFIDTKFHELPRYDKETKPTLDSESLYPGQREDILAGVSDYRKEIDMMNKREKKISILSEERKNLLARIGMYQKREQRVMKNDDEASPETGSSQSDLGAFSEIQVNTDAEFCQMKKKEKALKKRKKKKKEMKKKKRSYY